MKKSATLKSVNMVKIRGEWKCREEIDPCVFDNIIERIIEQGIEQIGFQRVKKKQE